jgi:hypothetical protein
MSEKKQPPMNADQRRRSEMPLIELAGELGVYPSTP